MANLQLPTTYAAKYATDADPPYAGDYTALLLSEAPTANGPAPADVLATLLLSNELAPKVHLGLVFCATPPHVIARTFFRTARYPALPGQPSPWDDRIFAHGSEVINGQSITTFEFPATAFTATAADGIAWDADTLTEQFANLPADTIITGAVDPDSPHAVVTRTRLLTRVPHRYIPLVLGQRLTPRALWTTLGTTIIADGNEVSCAPLLDWLRLACSPIPGPTPADLLPPLNCIGPKEALIRPEVDPILHAHRWSMVLADLPALAAATLPPVQPVEALIHALRDDRLADRTAASAERELDRATTAAARLVAAAPKPPSEAFPVLIDGLLRTCEVQSETDLPPLWPRISAAPAKHRRALLQEAIMARAQDDSAATRLYPVITKHVSETVFQLKFGAYDTDNATEGIHPSQLAHKACGLGTIAQAQADTYDLTLDRLAAPTLAEQAQLVPVMASPPADTYALDHTVRAMSLLLDVLFGLGHRLSHHYCVDFLGGPWPTALLAFNRHHAGSNAAIAPSHAGLILRKLQLLFVTFFNNIRQGQPPPALPPFGQLIEAMVEHNYGALPPLPPRFFPSLPGGNPLATPYAPPSTAPVPPAPTPSRPAPPVNRPGAPREATSLRTIGNRVVNDTLSASFKSKFDASTRTLRDLKENAPHTHLCLSYHLRGGCYDNCGRAASHKPLSASDRSTLTDYITAHLAPPAAVAL
jgi:hypothetical protein